MFNLYTHIKTNYFRFSIIINYIYEVYYILKKIIMPSKRTQIHFRYLLFSTVLLGLWSSQTVAFANENVTTKSATITTTSESTTQTSTVSEPSSQLEKILLFLWTKNTFSQLRTIPTPSQILRLQRFQEEFSFLTKKELPLSPLKMPREG